MIPYQIRTRLSHFDMGRPSGLANLLDSECNARWTISAKLTAKFIDVKILSSERLKGGVEGVAHCET